MAHHHHFILSLKFYVVAAALTMTLSTTIAIVAAAAAATLKYIKQITANGQSSQVDQPTTEQTVYKSYVWWRL